MMITIKDVARVAGVSTSTVSRVVRKQGKVGTYSQSTDQFKKQSV
ncbi:LacI family DNA-binding transcriptional regulator [Colwellia piezophila]|nr:LacI family DNA-binding transcriptional regulator [Colwellia piezophila]